MRPMDAGLVVTELFAAFGRRDVDAALALVTADAELWPQGTASELDREEPYRGHSGIRQYFADIATVWESLVVTPGELRVAGNGVVAFGTANGRTLAGDVLDGVPVIWVFRLENGLVRTARITPTGPAAT
ncbi:MAG: hypothetical protein JWM31_2910 [Solirubrobacterales bacterium]|nr:hypothetical protein [Solirubrobacterales bacterium]